MMTGTPETIEIKTALIVEAVSAGKEFGKAVGQWAVNELPENVGVRTDGLVAGYKRKLIDAGEPEDVANAVAHMMGCAILDEVKTIFDLSEAMPAGHA